MSFPTLVFRCPGAHFAHNGQTYDYLAVADESAMGEKIKAGWHESLAAAVAAISAPKEKAPEPKEDGEISREELEGMAESLGIKFDGRTSDAGLLKKIEAATSGGE